MASRLPAFAKPAHRRAAAGLAAVALLGSLGLSGCGLGKAVTAVKKVTHEVNGNRSTIDQFTSSMKTATATPFVATYRTTGQDPTTVVYAVQPPHDVSFTETPAGGSDGTARLDLVVNSSGQYSCSPPATGTAWSCQKIGKLDSLTQNAIADFYTPSHWVNFLKGFSLAAGFAGDKISTTNMTVNGFSMNCVVFKTPGVTGTSRICTTSQGILGYVKVAQDPTSFELTKFSSSPSASLFQLPAGAKIITPGQ
jgi:hypothetical protein